MATRTTADTAAPRRPGEPMATPAHHPDDESGLIVAAAREGLAVIALGVIAGVIGFALYKLDPALAAGCILAVQVVTRR